jgi:hypothetical protein
MKEDSNKGLKEQQQLQKRKKVAGRRDKSSLQKNC